MYRHPSQPVVLDLHPVVVDRTEPFWLKTEDLLEHRKSVKLWKNLQVYVLDERFHLILVALHAVRHGYYRLGWFYDLYKMDSIWRDSEERKIIYEFCSKNNILRALLISLGLSSSLFHKEKEGLSVESLDRWTAFSIRRRNKEIIQSGGMKYKKLKKIMTLLDIQDNLYNIFSYLFRISLPPLFLVTGEQSYGKRQYWKYGLNRINAIQNLFGT